MEKHGKKREMKLQAITVSELNLMLSTWLMASPFLLGYASSSTVWMWDAIIVGAIALILALIRVANPERGAWLGRVNVMLGLWLIVAPFVLGTSTVPTAMQNNRIVGIGFVLLGTWDTLASRTPSS